MKPKTRHIVAALLFTAAASFGQLSSPWNFTQDVARAESQQTPMQWFAAETLELNLWSRRLSSAVDFSDPGLKLLWEVVAQTNVQTTWAATTGTVTAATNGAARYSLNNQQANLPAGSYLGFVRAVWTNGTITSNVVLQYQAITVKASGNSALYPVADPITQAYGITGAYVNAGGSVTQAGRTLYFNIAGSYATGGQWNASVAGASNLALAAYAAASNAAAFATDATARAWAQAASNLAATANANQTAASNSLSARLLAVSNAIPSTAGFATNNAWRADTERVGLVASNALAGLPSLVGLSNGVTAAAQAATNAHLLALAASNTAAAALAGLPSLAALSNAASAAAVAATNADAKAAQAQALGTNAYALAVTASNLAASSVKYQDTRGFTNTGGARFSGAITADGGLSSTGSIRITNGDESNTISNTGIVLEGGGANPFRIANQIAQVSGTTVLNFGERRGYGSWTLGGEGAGELSGSVTIYASNLVWWNTSLFETGKLNAATLVGVDGSGLTNLPSSGGGAQSPLTNSVNGAGFTVSNATFYGDGYGLTNLWIVSPDNQYLNTNAMPREFGWIGGQRNRFLPGLFQPGGTNVYGLVGGGGYSNAWLMSIAQGTMIAGGVSNFALQDISGAALVGGIGNSINNAKHAGWLGGRSCTVNGEASASLAGQGNTISGGWSVGGGRENTLAANYGVIAGYQNQIQSGALWASIVGGRTNIIEGASYGSIGGGGWNTIGAAGLYGTIPGGTSNRVLGVGGFAAGNAAVVAANTTNSFMFNGALTGWTNSTSRSMTFNMPGGITMRGPEYGGNAGRGVLTGGVCVINLPFAMSDAAYSIHLTYATDAALLTPLSATGTTSAIYILGSGNNPFHWQVKGVTP